MVFRRYDELAIRNILRLSDILDEIDGKRESGYELAQIIKEYCEHDEPRHTQGSYRQID